MKFLLLFLISIIFIIPYKLIAASADTTQKERQFTKAELVADVNYMVKTIADVHPNMYHSISKKQYESLTKNVISQLHNGMTEKQAWPVMAPLVGALNEGHSNFNYPNDLLGGLKTGKDLLFPVVLREFDGRYLIVRIDGSAEDILLPGDKIVSINGIKASQLVDNLSTCSGGLRLWRANDVCRNIVVYMFMYNIKAPYHITYLRRDKIDSAVLKPTAFADYAGRIKAKATKQPASPSPGNYSFNNFGNGKVLLTVNSLAGDLGEFKHFLDSAFTNFKQTNTNTLIIDLRRNGGGNSALAEALLGYITDKPFRMTGGVKWKISEEYKAQIRKNADSATLKNMAYYLDGKNGAILENSGPKPEKTAENNLLFKGTVFVLIGPKTFSSANMLANTIQDYKLATLVGEPSGEPANDYGELISVKLPNTGFTFTTSVKQFVRANGDAKDDHPVLPDHLVKDDLATPADEVLEYVKKL